MLEDDVKTYLSDIKSVIDKLQYKKIEEIIEVLHDAYENSKTVYTMGNGGHGSTASHWINDLAKHLVVSEDKTKVVVSGKRLRTLCLNDSISTLTGWANDTGYENCFSEQLKNWVEKGDVVIGISGSGNSENVLRAFMVAKEKGAKTICLSGKSGGRAKDITDICIVVPSNHDGYIEDIHMILAHLSSNILKKVIQSKHD